MLRIRRVSDLGLVSALKLQTGIYHLPERRRCQCGAGAWGAFFRRVGIDFLK